MMAGLSPSSCCGVTPFNVSTPSSNPLLANARNKNITAYTRNIRAPNTIRPAPLRKYCSLDIVSSLLLAACHSDRFAGSCRSRGVAAFAAAHSFAPRYKQYDGQEVPVRPGPLRGFRFRGIGKRDKL